MQADQLALFSGKEEGYSVVPIPYAETKDLILNTHYAGRMPPVKVAFGLDRDGERVGVVTYGIPPSHTLLKGVCGEDYKGSVIELNRLVLRDNLKNEASILVGRSLRMLGDRIVVSYADSVQNHTGFVYQATNFLYTGQTKPVKEVYLKSRPHLHHTTHGRKTFAQMIELHGEDVGFRYRSIKHRYVTFVGSKTFKRKARKALRYKVSAYPKGDEKK